MLKFLESLTLWLVRCRHKKCSLPITIKPGKQASGVAALTGTYFVCLDCGKEFAYDLHTMRVVKAPSSKPEPANCTGNEELIGGYRVPH
jgi:hypothetical protein